MKSNTRYYNYLLMNFLSIYIRQFAGINDKAALTFKMKKATFTVTFSS